MARAARAPDEHEDGFFAALLEATLIVPRPPVRLDARGRERFALFSSRAALRRFDPDADASATEVAAAELFPLALASALPAVLNLGGDLYYELSTDELRALAQGLLPGVPVLRPEVLPSGHRLVVGAPERNPLELKRALLAALPGLPAVQRAFLVQIADRHSPRLLLGLELAAADEDEMRAVVVALDPVLQEALGPGERIDVAMLNGTSLIAACEAVGPAFYRVNIPVS